MALGARAHLLELQDDSRVRAYRVDPPREMRAQPYSL